MNNGNEIRVNMLEGEDLELDIPAGVKRIRINIVEEILDNAAAAASSPEQVEEVKEVKEALDEAEADPTPTNTTKAQKVAEEAVTNGTLTQDQFDQLLKASPAFMEQVVRVDNVNDTVSALDKAMPKDSRGNYLNIIDTIDEEVHTYFEENFNVLLKQAGINLEAMRFSIARFLVAGIISGLVAWLVIGMLAGWFSGLIIAVLLGGMVGLGTGFTNKPKRERNRYVAEEEDVQFAQTNSSETNRTSLIKRGVGVVVALVALVLIIVIIKAIVNA